ncbi:MAG: hypothetical protein KDA37_01385 [Planctomycetales bacterium]|nr:hypothetical protein [Planctomycetales bacterium]
MYTPQQRARLREWLLERARGDERIGGAAITGSAALDREDDWSDIDLAFGVQASADLDAVVADWSGAMYESHAAIDHLDVVSGATLYRVFLLANTLQVDLAFSPAGEFRPRADSFQLVFGTAAPMQRASQDARRLAGWGWLYAIHARSSIARGRLWQAEFMISGLRDQAVALACLRHGLPSSEARGIDDLPVEVRSAFAKSLIGSVGESELTAAFQSAIPLLIAEITALNGELGAQLAVPLREIAGL